MGGSITPDGIAPPVILFVPGQYRAYTKKELGPNPYLLTPFTVRLQVTNNLTPGGGAETFLQGVGIAAIFSSAPTVPAAVSAAISGGWSVVAYGSVKPEEEKVTPTPSSK